MNTKILTGILLDLQATGTDLSNPAATRTSTYKLKFNGISLCTLRANQNWQDKTSMVIL